MHLQHTWKRRLSLLAGAALSIAVVIVAGNLLGVVADAVLQLPAASDQYAFVGGVVAGTLLATVWAAIAGYRLLTRALQPATELSEDFTPTGAIRRGPQS